MSGFHVPTARGLCALYRRDAKSTVPARWERAAACGGGGVVDAAAVGACGSLAPHWRRCCGECEL